MLMLTRKIGERIKIGEDVYVKVVEVRDNQVRIGIEAPKDVPVVREGRGAQLAESIARR